MNAAPGLRHQERLLPTLNAVLMPATTARFHDSATAYAFTKPFFLFRPRPPPLSFASTRSPSLLPFSASLCLGRSYAGCVYRAATFSSSNIQGFISLSTIALGCTTWFRDGSVLLVSLVLTKRNGGMEFFPGHLVDWEPYSDPYLRRGRDMRGWFCLFFFMLPGECYRYPNISISGFSGRVRSRFGHLWILGVRELRLWFSGNATCRVFILP